VHVNVQCAPSINVNHFSPDMATRDNRSHGCPGP
jgi:hypothetical protein